MERAQSVEKIYIANNAQVQSIVNPTFYTQVDEGNGEDVLMRAKYDATALIRLSTHDPEGTTA